MSLIIELKCCNFAVTVLQLLVTIFVEFVEVEMSNSSLGLQGFSVILILNACRLQKDTEHQHAGAVTALNLKYLQLGFICY